jgi:lysophospholipase L1-like esterase
MPTSHSHAWFAPRLAASALLLAAVASPAPATPTGPTDTSATTTRAGDTTARRPPSDLDFRRLLPRAVSKSVVHRDPGHFVWDPALIRTDEGTYHLLYSRWATSLGFDAWATHAEIAWATAKAPEGPYTFQKVVLPSRGGAYWDGHSVFNTAIIRYQGRFYLYYTGNRGNDAWHPDRPTRGMSDEEWWLHRNHQRIGVATADHPGGPWTRRDTPLLDVGPDTGQVIINVPNPLVRPDGKVMLFYKTLAPGEGKFGGGVVHYPSVGDGPLGPFKRHPTPMVDKRALMKTDHHFDFHIDDHFEWYQEDRYYAIVKDHDAPFMTPHGRSLLLFESADGFEWKPSRHSLVQGFEIAWTDGTSQKFERLEMPKLLIEGGRPRTLALAALPDHGKESYIVLLPIAPVPTALDAPVPAIAKAPGGDRPARVMAIGDSITACNPRDYSCYTWMLDTRLREAGCRVEFVGSQVSNAPQGPIRHEGYGNKAIEYLADTVPAHFREAPADIVLIHAGHNHFDHEQPVPGMVAATERLVAALRAVNPNVVVLLARVEQSGKLPKYAYIADFNRALVPLAARLDTPRQPVRLVDHATGFDWRTDTIDDHVHPNAHGARKIADRWFDALAPVIGCAGGPTRD